MGQSSRSRDEKCFFFGHGCTLGVTYFWLFVDSLC